MARLRWAILRTLIAVALASSLVAVMLGSQEWDALLLNPGTEMAGAAATYGLLELVIAVAGMVNRRRQWRATA